MFSNFARWTGWAAVVGAACVLLVGSEPKSSSAGQEAVHCAHPADHIALAAAAGPAALADPADPAGRGMPSDVAELVRQVHQASLVEIWVGQRAQEVSENPSVRWVGRQLIIEHEQLDKHVADVATRYDISLPPEPTLWQQTGARKMARETGRAFDLAFANTLYYGHDRVMGLIGRAKQAVAARPAIDPKLRKFVEVGEAYVARHMQWLLATGMVTTASTASAERQVDTAQVVSRTNTFSNAIPALLGVASLVLIVALVTAAKAGTLSRS